jgi:hypothetical protein
MCVAHKSYRPSEMPSEDTVTDYSDTPVVDNVQLTRSCGSLRPMGGLTEMPDPGTVE